MEKGIKQGEEKGKLEKQKQIALNMKIQINSDRATIQINSDRIAIQGFDDNTIAKCLNINIDDLKLLLNSK